MQAAGPVVVSAMFSFILRGLHASSCVTKIYLSVHAELMYVQCPDTEKQLHLSFVVNVHSGVRSYTAKWLAS